MSMSLAHYLKRARERYGLSQRELAKRARISFVGLQAIENGQTQSPGVQTLIALARGLNVPPVNLMLAFEGKDPDSVPHCPVFTHADVQHLLEQALHTAITQIKTSLMTPFPVSRGQMQ